MVPAIDCGLIALDCAVLICAVVNLGGYSVPSSAGTKCKCVVVVGQNIRRWCWGWNLGPYSGHVQDRQLAHRASEGRRLGSFVVRGNKIGVFKHTSFLLYGAGIHALSS
jgi:hypothetical protein